MYKHSMTLGLKNVLPEDGDLSLKHVIYVDKEDHIVEKIR